MFSVLFGHFPGYFVTACNRLLLLFGKYMISNFFFNVWTAVYLEYNQTAFGRLSESFHFAASEVGSSINRQEKQSAAKKCLGLIVMQLKFSVASIVRFDTSERKIDSHFYHMSLFRLQLTKSKPNCHNFHHHLRFIVI